jgi:hypothetical protein
MRRQVSDAKARRVHYAVPPVTGMTLTWDGIFE